MKVKSSAAKIAFALLIALLGSAGAAVAQPSHKVVGQTGDTPIMEVNSAFIPDELQIISKTIASIGFADTFSTKERRLLDRDIVIADEIVLERGTTLIIAPKNVNERNQVFFIARTIKVVGSGAPPVVQWDRNSVGILREQGRIGKAAPGSAGDREGADGRPGATGVVGNRGFAGRDGPTLIFIAMKFEIAPVLFDIAGQDGGNGGPGQDGGDGGPGRAGRPGQIGTGSIRQRSETCEPAIHGGNGGRGGDGGPGGEGGAGGDGGYIAMLGAEVDGKAVATLVHPKSRFPGGQGGRRGLRGLGGSGGGGAPTILAVGGCESSKAGTIGANGEGRKPDEQLSASRDFGRPGDPGMVGFSKLAPSQSARIFSSERR